jgi:hypothetical protein
MKAVQAGEDVLGGLVNGAVRTAPNGQKTVVAAAYALAVIAK